MNFLKKIPASMNGLLVVMALLVPVVMLGGNATGLMPLFMGLYIAIGAIGGLGCLVFERSQKTKADDFSKSVETNAASADGLKDPQKIAQMDHMRKEFQRGIDIYKKHGKDLYSLPWYVVVGESESGKTEMLRRSEIGFPDKLQDRWQGSGGTLSMHWWFSNKAVILDTAGRLFVTEGAEGGQNQWVNFLQMLKKNRPDCPINGLILVIPSNRLLTHPNPEMEATRMAELDKNAGQIAKQMETLQAQLGVRFPVYILITKMDKLNGFREFFGKIDKPEERYQILGWSNPGPLGETFDPQSVTEYMHSVADRLKRRMMSELRNVEPEDTNGLRIDEVDGLYAFPSSFESMSGKLTSYLRHVFATDEWSAKPPFLRGIYFTSALQQGMVLDEALAAAMGVPFERMDSNQVDDGLSLSKNRTYFVRDLFLDKIFNEKGLVTTAGKIQSKISGWKLWLPATILLTLGLIGLVGYKLAHADDESRKWTSLWTSDAGREKHRIPPLATHENEELRPAKPAEATKLLTALEAIGQDVRGKPRFGWIFTPAQWFDGDLSEDRQILYSDLVSETLSNLELAIIAKLTADVDQGNKATDKWDDEEWEALHALVLLQHAHQWNDSKGTIAIKDSPERPWLLSGLIKPLFNFAKIRSDKNLDLEASLGRSIQHAGKLPNSIFQKQLKNRQGRALRDLMEKLIPVEQLEKQRQFVDDLNTFHRSLIKLDEYNASNVDKLADSALKLKQSGEVIQTAVSNQDAKHLSSDRETLLAFILAHASLAEEFGYDASAKADDLESGAKALLAQDGALLKSVIETLQLVKSNPTISLNSGNIDAFVTAPLSPAPTAEGPDAEALQKDTQKILSALGKLKKSWFENEFFSKQFKRYLRLPIASDATVGNNDELLTLWKLCNLAEKWQIEKAKAQQLIRTFNCFFDTARITSTDVIGALRPCQLNFVKLQGQAVAKYSIKAEGVEVAEFNLMEADMKPANLKLNQTLTFYKDSSPDGNVPSWGLIKDIKIGQQNPWRHASPSGACYDITIQGINLDPLGSWLKTSDF